MPHRLSPYFNSFRMTEMMCIWAFDAVSEEHAAYRLSDKTNTIRGQLAHLVISRHSLCRSLDINVADLPWEHLGEGMEAGFVECEDFPSLAALRSEWEKLAKVFLDGLEQVADDVLARPAPFPLPWNPTPNLEDMVALTVVHESYHIGQLGMTVKTLTGRGLMNPPA